MKDHDYIIRLSDILRDANPFDSQDGGRIAMTREFASDVASALAAIAVRQQRIDKWIQQLQGTDVLVVYGDPRLDEPRGTIKAK